MLLAVLNRTVGYLIIVLFTPDAKARNAGV